MTKLSIASSLADGRQEAKPQYSDIQVRDASLLERKITGRSAISQPMFVGDAATGEKSPIRCTKFTGVGDISISLSPTPC